LKLPPSLTIINVNANNSMCFAKNPLFLQRFFLTHPWRIIVNLTVLLMIVLSDSFAYQTFIVDFRRQILQIWVRNKNGTQRNTKAACLIVI